MTLRARDVAKISRRLDDIIAECLSIDIKRMVADGLDDDAIAEHRAHFDRWKDATLARIVAELADGTAIMPPRAV